MSKSDASTTLFYSVFVWLKYTRAGIETENSRFHGQYQIEK